jgi:hypothetical protein
MATVSGSISYSGGPDTYTYTVNYSVSWTPNSTNRTTAPANGYQGTASCGQSMSFGVNWSERIGTTTYSGTDYITGTAPACPPPPPTYPPGWSDNTLGAFQAESAYSDSVSASNMLYSGSYSISSGSLPTGLSFSQTGSGSTLAAAITGTPTTAGQSYSFTIQASNSYGSVSQAFSGTVAASPTAGKLRVWTGTTWVVAPAKVWNGTTWVAGTVKVWNGTAWVTSV